MPDSIPQPRLNPNVSVDCVIFGFDFNELKVLIIERNDPTGKGVHMLPGNLVRDDEDLDNAANRVLKELTSLENIYLEQFRVFGAPNRVLREKDQAWLRSIREHPEARVITVAYYSLIKLSKYKPAPSSFARRATWIPIREVPELAFDHDDILKGAQYALRQKLRIEPIGFELLPRKFTLGQLQKLYEEILETQLDKRNFRRKMINKGILSPLKEKQEGVPHKPAQLFQFDQKKYDELKSNEFDFVL